MLMDRLLEAMLSTLIVRIRPKTRPRHLLLAYFAPYTAFKQSRFSHAMVSLVIVHAHRGFSSLAWL